MSNAVSGESKWGGGYDRRAITPADAKAPQIAQRPGEKPDS